MNKFLTIISGFIMGIANIVPGISGGTILVLLGLYDKTIKNITNLTKKEERFNSIRFLFFLGIGLTFGIIIGSVVIKLMLEANYSQSLIFFSTLILLSLPKFYKDTFKQKNDFNIILFIVSSLLLISLIILSLNIDKQTDINNIPRLDIGLACFLALGGIIAGFAMIFPGISGSMIQLIIGSYIYFTSFITMIPKMNFDLFMYLSIISASIGIGVLIGVIISGYLLNKFKFKTYSVITGLIVGSCTGLFVEAYHVSTVDINFIVHTLTTIIITYILYLLPSILFTKKSTN